MRAKKLLDLVPIPSHVIKHAYSRITLTRFTTAYFIIALLYAVILSGLQLGSHISNKEADDTLLKIINVANIQSNAIPLFSSNGNGQGVLRLCNGIPESNNDDRCQTLVGPGADVTGTILANSIIPTPTTSSVASQTVQSTDAASATPQQAPADGVASAASVTSTTQDSGLAIAAVTTDSTDTAASTASFSLPSVSLLVGVDISEEQLLTTTTTSSDHSSNDSSRTTTSTSTRSTTSTSTSTTSKSTTSTTEDRTTTSTSTARDTSTSKDTTSTTSTTTTTSSTSTSTSDSAKSTSASKQESTSASSTTEVSASAKQAFAIPTASSETASETGNTGGNSSNGAAQSTSSSKGQSSTASLSSDSSSQTATAGGSQPQRRSSGRYQSRPLVALYRRTFSVVPVTNATTGTVVGLNVTDLAHNGSSAVTFVNVLCAATLTFPEEQLHQAWAEDLVMLGYHFWLFGLSLVAVLNESIPHLLAAFVSSVLALIWSIVHLVQIGSLQKQWQEFVTDGACNGLDILPSFWDQRKTIEIPAVVFNSAFVIALGVVGFRLLSVYRRQTEKLAGGSDVIKHVYKTTLVLSIIIQIAAFLLIASLALWLQQLFGSAIASFSTSTPALKGVGILSILLSLPWFYIGWYAVRREHKIVMLVFFGATIFFLATWVVVFSSDVYRLVFTQWTFFAVITVSTFFLLVGSLITSIVCRLHFGQGLAIQLTEKSKPQEPEGTWDFSNNAEQAWERFDKESVRQSQFTNSDRQSAFSYGLRSPLPPMPKLLQPSRFSG